MMNRMNSMIISREDLSTVAAPSDLGTDPDIVHIVWGSDPSSSSSGASIDMQPIPEQPEAWVGSAGHDTGECLPCVWLRKKLGCRQGAACQFCHLCEKGAFKKMKQQQAAKARLETHHKKTTAAPHHAQPASASHQQLWQQQPRQQQPWRQQPWQQPWRQQPWRQQPWQQSQQQQQQQSEVRGTLTMSL